MRYEINGLYTQPVSIMGLKAIALHCMCNLQLCRQSVLHAVTSELQ